MALTRIKQFKYFVYTFLVLLLISGTWCGRSGGSRPSSSGGSRSSSHSTSHSSSSHSSPSHSSPSHSISHASPSHSSSSHSSPSHSFGSTSHSTFGSSPHLSGSGSHSSGSAPHPTFTGGSQSSHFGSGSHPNPPSTHLGASAPSLPGYTVTGGAGFIPHASGGSKPIGFDHVNQQAHNPPVSNVKPITSPSGIGFDHHQQTHNTPLNSGRPLGSTGAGAPPPVYSGPPGYTVTGGAPIPNKPSGIGFDHVTPLTNTKPLTPQVVPAHVNPSYGAPPGYTVTGGSPVQNKPAGIGFDHVNQQANNNINPGRPVPPPSTGGVITPQHINPVHSGPQGSNFASNVPHQQPSYPLNAGARPGIGFDHVNQQSGVHHVSPTYQPYRPQTIVQSSGYVHYQPPVQLQYSPPVTIHHTTTHIVPVYQPAVIHTYNTGGSFVSHGSSFLGGYLIGRLASGDNYHHHGYQNTHVTNNYYNNDRNDGSYYNGGSTSSASGAGNNYNSYYTIHHYHQNREQVPPKFSVPGEDLTQCQSNTTDQLCVPNTSAFCLKNGTIMCTTPTILTTPCGQNLTDRCVYSRIDCNGSPSCNATANQTYIDFYLPCISNVTYVDNKVLDSTQPKTQGSYELCVTALAHPKKLESPVFALATLFTEFGKWHLEQLSEIHKQNNS